MYIFDGHSHYMPPEVARHTTFFKVNWSDIDRHLSVMDQNKIQSALLLYPTSDAHLQMKGGVNVCAAYNPAISDIAIKYPDRFVGAGILPLDNPKECVKELERIRSLNLKVLSLPSSYEGKYLDDSLFEPIFEFAQKNKMPIHVHPQIISPIGEERVKDPLLTPVLSYVFDVSMCIGKMMMMGTFLKFSDVNFIFAHYGGVLPIVKERFDNTYTMLRKREFVKDIQKLPSEYFKNLFIDTSGSKSAASFLCALEIVDSKNIIFGSDFPANQNLADSMGVIERATLSDEQKRFVLGNNLLKLLDLGKVKA